MEKQKDYKELLNVKINLEYLGQVLNSYKITRIRPTERFMVGLEGSGRIYNCMVNWENKNIEGAYPTMDFPENVFEEFLKDGVSYMPFSDNKVCYRLIKRTNVN